MKEWRKVAILCGLIFFSYFLYAQENKINNRIEIEFGVNEFIGNTVVPDRVRAGDIIKSGDTFNNTIDVPYIGIKYEWYFPEKRVGFAAGLRFSQFISAIHGKTSWLFLPFDKSFLWQFSEEDVYTNYLQISRITQTDNYLGVPLEFRYLLKKNDSFFRPYVKIGAVVNKLLYTTNSVTFNNKQMNQYADAVGKQVDKPSSFNSYIYPAFGFEIGDSRLARVNLEIHYIPFLIPKKTYPFLSPDYGIGMQISLQIPIP